MGDNGGGNPLTGQKNWGNKIKDRQESRKDHVEDLETPGLAKVTSKKGPVRYEGDESH